ncbi:avidin/streptavidin family protein [Rhizorhabdus sp. FW153]|uniref:avidin/streptavidin family protein n=1 Tax=Rhizorhabdus sp. FW153 TaxID=3400216 RepID=UPI003CF470D6
MSLAGIWENEYGSRMTLSLADPNLIVGKYESTTGSTGEYRVIGYQASADPTSSAGQACALAIDWHSVVAGPPDNSWHWVSGLSGQLSLQSSGEQLVLSHAMVASVAFPGLAQAGTYIDKLIYTRVGEQHDIPAEPLPGEEVLADNPLVGSWFAQDGTALLIQSVVPYAGNAFGYVFGKLIWNGGPSLLYGVTDINAGSAGLDLQSVSIVGLPSDAGGPAISLAGTLDLSSGVLTLLDQNSSSTAPDATYVETTISSKTFTRQ